METIDGWKAKQRAESLIKLREGNNPLSEFTKQAGKGNRINPERQSKIIIALRMVGDHMDFGWLGEFCTQIEDYQTTCGSPHAAREMLLSAIQFTEFAEHDRSKTSLTLSGDGGKK